jgi:hypothetical protein
LHETFVKAVGTDDLELQRFFPAIVAPIPPHIETWPRCQTHCVFDIRG